MDPISTPSWARSISDLWEAALTPLVGLEPSDPAYWLAAYPNDLPEVRHRLAISQSGCGLTQLVAARALRVTTYPEADRPYRGHSDAVTLCEAIFRRCRPSAWHGDPVPGLGVAHGLERGMLVVVGGTGAQRAVMGGWEHVQWIASVRAGEVEVIEGGGPGVHRRWHPVTVRGGHLWIGTRRVAGVGDVGDLEIAPPTEAA